MERTSSAKMSEALELLEEAARQKKDELKSVMSDKYTHLRNAVTETETSLVKSLTDAGKHAVKAAVHARDFGAEKAREIGRDVDNSVHGNPWPYIAGTAGVGLLLGYILGRNRK